MPAPPRGLLRFSASGLPLLQPHEARGSSSARRLPSPPWWSNEGPDLPLSVGISSSVWQFPSSPGRYYGQCGSRQFVVRPPDPITSVSCRASFPSVVNFGARVRSPESSGQTLFRSTLPPSMDGTWGISENVPDMVVLSSKWGLSPIERLQSLNPNDNTRAPLPNVPAYPGLPLKHRLN